MLLVRRADDDAARQWLTRWQTHYPQAVPVELGLWERQHRNIWGNQLKRLADRLVFPVARIDATQIAQWRDALAAPADEQVLAVCANRLLSAHLGLGSDGTALVIAEDTVTLSGWDEAPVALHHAAIRFAALVAEAARRLAIARRMVDAERDAFAQHRPDVVLLDLAMPPHHHPQGGVALILAFATAPVVVMTGHADLALALQAVKAGAWDFLAKPVDPDILKVAVACAVERARSW